jgi:diguanylate cyclase (GGDEF)-like protein/PAS domain S-box-containing protein
VNRSALSGAGEGGRGSTITAVTVSEPSGRERMLRAAIDNVVDAIVVIDDRFRTTFANRAADELVGEPAGGATGMDGLSLIHPDDHGGVFGVMAGLLLRPGGTDVTRFRVSTRTGWMWVEANATNLLGDPDVGGIVVSFRNITHQRALERSARHDPLTDLANRVVLTERLEQALADGAAAGTRTAVLFLDLDHFKVINDRGGHGVGDRVLVEVARALRDTVPEADVIARFGGDEFVVLLRDVPSSRRAVAVAERVLARLRFPVEVAGTVHHVSASVGIAVTRGGASAAASAPSTLLRDADQALYRAKERRGGWCLAGADRRSRVRRPADAGAGLEEALDRDEVTVDYQPVVDDRGVVVARRARVRWARPGAGSSAPSTAALASCRPAVLHRLDDRLVELVRAELLNPGSPGRSPLPVVLPLVASPLGRHGWGEHLRARLAPRPGLRQDPAPVTIELPEEVLVADLVRSAQLLGELRGAGFKVAMGGFGAGPASLRGLAELALDAVILDRSWWAQAGRPPPGTVLRAVVALAHDLGMRVVADGVDDEVAAREALALGCDRLLGELVARSGSPLAV